MAENSFREPWVEEFIDNMKVLTENHALKLCNIIAEIGMEEKSRKVWVKTFTEQMIDVYKDVSNQATEVQNELCSSIESLLKKANFLCKKLNIKMPEYGSEELRLWEEEKLLSSKVEELEIEVNNRQREITALHEYQQQLCHFLGKEAQLITDSPLPSRAYICDFRKYLDGLREEKEFREKLNSQLKQEITSMAHKLQYVPTLDFEKLVLSSLDKFLMTDNNMVSLNAFHKTLKYKLKELTDEISFVKENIRKSWKRLQEDIEKCNKFLQNNCEVSVETLQKLRLEEKRLETMRKSQIRTLAENLRKEILELWDRCHYAAEQREEFCFLNVELYTDDLLNLYEIEIKKLKDYYAQNSELFHLLEQHSELWTKMIDLENRATAPDRYKNRGGQLLKEEKERNALLKRIPQLEEKLLQLAQIYQTSMGKPFLSRGKTVEAVLAELYESREQDKILKLSARKLQRENAITPAKNTPYKSPTKRKIAKSLFSNIRPCALAEHTKSNVPPGSTPLKKNMAPPNRAPDQSKINKNKRLSADRKKRLNKCRRISQQMKRKAPNTSTDSEYTIFKNDITKKPTFRSTEVFIEDLPPIL